MGLRRARKISQYYKDLYTQFLNGKAPAPENECPDIVIGFEYFEIPKYSKLLPYETVFPLKEIKFCNHKFFCPNDLDTYLTNLYGDYMTYPTYIDNIHTDVGKMSIDDILKIKEFIKK